jgi:NAD(P)H-dependent FMN reductase
MKITVLNGSPKGITSVTMQYIHYIQKMFPQHELDIVNVAQQIKKIERDERAFQKVIEKVQASDGILWAFPLYILHVHGNYKRSIELVWASTRQRSRRPSTFSITRHTTTSTPSAMTWGCALWVRSPQRCKIC